MKKRIVAILLLAVMLLCIGCGKQNDTVEAETESAAQTEQVKPMKTKTEKKDEEKKDEETEKQSTSQTTKSSGSSSNKSQDFTSSKAYYIKVNCQMNTVTVYTKDSSGLFTVPCRAMVCSTGWETPTGTYDISYQGQWNWLTLVGQVYGQYCTQITGDYLFHSVPYTQRYNKGSLQPGEYDKLGTTCSHGCIRLTVADAKWIYDNKYNIARVEIYNSSDPGPLGKPYAQKIGSAADLWDPTDPDSSNPWRNATVTVGNYVGKTETDAVSAASAAGLSVGEIDYQYSGSAEGTVIAQSLESDVSVAKGTVIILTVSKGPEPVMVTVGSYVGKSEEEAVAQIEALGLTAAVVYQESDTNGIVLDQSVAADTSVEAGTTITLTVSQMAEQPEQSEVE